MRKVFFILAALCVPLLFVSCGGDDEPSGAENGSLGGGTSGKTDNHEYVDLGLTSGTLWATMNVGATKPEEYGDYFAWGETTPKQNYSRNNYKWYNTEGKYTKYCTDGYKGVVDNKTELELADDAAYVNWGKNWRMPSNAQFEELRAECTWQWNGRGHLFTSKKNNNTLFLPAADCISAFSYAGKNGFYWSRTTDRHGSLTGYYNMRYSSGELYWIFVDRYIGCSVRAVRVP